MILPVSILLPSILLQFIAASLAISQIRVGRFAFAWGTIAFAMALIGIHHVVTLVCTENLIRVDDVMELPKLAE